MSNYQRDPEGNYLMNCCQTPSTEQLFPRSQQASIHIGDVRRTIQCTSSIYLYGIYIYTHGMYIYTHAYAHTHKPTHKIIDRNQHRTFLCYSCHAPSCTCRAKWSPPTRWVSFGAVEVVQSLDFGISWDLGNWSCHAKINRNIPMFIILMDELWLL